MLLRRGVVSVLCGLCIFQDLFHDKLTAFVAKLGEYLDEWVSRTVSQSLQETLLLSGSGERATLSHRS